MKTTDTIGFDLAGARYCLYCSPVGPEDYPDTGGPVFAGPDETDSVCDKCGGLLVDSFPRPPAEGGGPR